MLYTTGSSFIIIRLNVVYVELSFVTSGTLEAKTRSACVYGFRTGGDTQSNVLTLLFSRLHFV